MTHGPRRTTFGARPMTRVALVLLVALVVLAALTGWFRHPTPGEAPGPTPGPTPGQTPGNPRPASPSAPGPASPSALGPALGSPGMPGVALGRHHVGAIIGV